ncbi:MAG: hypothetical protein ACRCSG_00390 [Cellulosilyticaceae bacterium]
MNLKTAMLKKLVSITINRSDENNVYIKVKHLKKLKEVGKEVVDKFAELVKLLPGIQKFSMNVDNEEIHIVFNKNQIKDQQILKWIKIITDVMIDESDFINTNVKKDVNKVVETLKNKLSKKVKDVVGK